MTNKKRIDKTQLTYVIVGLISMILCGVFFIASFMVEANTIEGLMHKNAVCLRWAFIMSIPMAWGIINAYARICEKKGKEVF